MNANRESWESADGEMVCKLCRYMERQSAKPELSDQAQVSEQRKDDGGSAQSLGTGEGRQERDDYEEEQNM